MLEIELPFPPSVNHYYRRVGAKTLISRRGRRYREIVQGLMRTMNLETLTGPLRMEIEIYPPDRRRRDLDNLQKSLWDALTHGGLYEDDSQVREFHGWMREPVPGGLAVVRVEETFNQKDSK